ncbi:hypothetical protein EYC84_002719 [Monilinia fructicola]|uniref:Uncharacterized protein n=1 Tax=Monilinia fructicola TaxID=38448 RepID=A0A5M9JPV9_MONFR|nr:hypothetical protein EYC84_002719 [Monilinia fructicola]
MHTCTHLHLHLHLHIHVPKDTSRRSRDEKFIFTIPEEKKKTCDSYIQCTKTLLNSCPNAKLPRQTR